MSKCPDESISHNFHFPLITAQPPFFIEIDLCQAKSTATDYEKDNGFCLCMEAISFSVKADFTMFIATISVELLSGSIRQRKVLIIDLERVGKRQKQTDGKSRCH